jgi:hypothetical protein
MVLFPDIMGSSGLRQASGAGSKRLREVMKGAAMDTRGDAKSLEHNSTPAEGTATESDRWEREREDAKHTRLARVQSSANVWLGILGTLFGLSGAVVLVKGSTAFVASTHNTWLHWGLIALVGMTSNSAPQLQRWTWRAGRGRQR